MFSWQAFYLSGMNLGFWYSQQEQLLTVSWDRMSGYLSNRFILTVKNGHINTIFDQMMGCIFQSSENKLTGQCNRYHHGLVVVIIFDNLP